MLLVKYLDTESKAVGHLVLVKREDFTENLMALMFICCLVDLDSNILNVHQPTDQTHPLSNLSLIQSYNHTSNDHIIFKSIKC